MCCGSFLGRMRLWLFCTRKIPKFPSEVGLLQTTVILPPSSNMERFTILRRSNESDESNESIPFIFLHPFIGPPFKVPKIITTITMTTPPWLSRALSLPSENSPWSPQPIVSMYLPYVQPTERSRRAAGRGTPPLDVACDKDDRSFFQELGSWMVFLGASSRVPIQRSLRIQTHS